MLKIILPGLAQTDEFLDLLGEAHLPKLDMLLARGRLEAIAQTNLEAMLCQELGIERQHDYPIAAIGLDQAGWQGGDAYWLRADPVHLRIERDQLILHEIMEPDPHELESLREALSTHFGESFSPLPLRSGAWAVRITGKVEITTTPLSLAAGQHIDPLLPAGPDALAWRKLLNEAQMLLFSHPVNQAREARGEPAINSVWLWGGGRLPETISQSSLTVLSDHADWRALAEYAGAKVRAMPDRWSADLPENALIVMDAPHRHLRWGDFDAWLQTMQNFEHNWLQPLFAYGRSFKLDDPSQGISLTWRSTYRWKFWRRTQKPVLPNFKFQQPEADAGVDVFGNRY